MALPEVAARGGVSVFMHDFWFFGGLIFACLLVILPGLVRFFKLSPDFPRGVSPPRATGRVAVPGVIATSGTSAYVGYA